MKNNLYTELYITINEKIISINNSKLLAINNLKKEIKNGEINSSPEGYLNASYNIEKLKNETFIFTDKANKHQFRFIDITSKAKKIKRNLKEFNVSEEDIIHLILKNLKKIDD